MIVTAESKTVQELEEEISGLYADLMGQEHRLGSKIEQLERALEQTSAANHQLTLKNVAYRARIEKFRAVLSVNHDSFYNSPCDECSVLREDYEADESE